jgi:drug/metabolite transporter (DMT)-like permease
MVALHAAVLLFGLAGLFGKLLPLSSLMIVAGRTFFASLSLTAYVMIRRQGSNRLLAKEIVLLTALGSILALHWWTFFHAIQISTVAVGLLGFAAFPMFVTMLEPIVFKEPLRGFDVFTALTVTAGLIAVAWPLDLQTGRTTGALWGVCSGFLFAVLSLLNRRYVRRHGSIRMAWFQNGVAFLLLLPLTLTWSASVWTLTWQQWLLLLILGVFCTAFSHALFIYSLAAVRAQLAGIVAALEPVYGIVFAFLLLGEVPTAATIMGGVMIVGTTVLAMFRRQSEDEDGRDSL